MIRNLVLSADVNTWPKNKPILLAGDWCINDYNQMELRNYDYKKMEDNFLTLDSIEKGSLECEKYYDSIVNDLSKRLNEIHKLNWNTRSWKILLGPWLLKFIELLYERWSVIEKIESIKDKIKIQIPKKIYGNLEIFDTDDLTIKAQSDNWNILLFSYLIKNFTNLKLELFENKINTEYLDLKDQKEKKENTISKFRFKTFIKRFLYFFLKPLRRETDGFFYFPYFKNFYDLVRLNLLLKQAPQIQLNTTVTKPTKKNNLVKKNGNLRKKLNILKNNGSRFDKILRQAIIDFLPKIYLENLDELKNAAEQNNFPSKPKFVLTTASGTLKDEPFKYWLSEKTFNGTQLISLQHGAVYGTEYFPNCIPKHEIDVSDKFLTWGWKYPHSKKSVKRGACQILKKNKNKFTANSKKNFLIVANGTRRYFRSFQAGLPCGSKVNDYFNLLKSITNSLINKNFEKEIKFKFHLSDINGDKTVKNYFLKNFPNIQHIELDSSYYDVVKSYKLTVHTFDSTAFYETIGIDIPVMLVINPEFNPFNKESKDYYNALEQVGIFHTSADSLAKKISQIYKNVDDWWNQTDVKEAKTFFCNNYVKSNNDLAKDYYNLITNKN